MLLLRFSSFLMRHQLVCHSPTPSPKHLAAELTPGVLPVQVSRCRAYIESLETKLAGQQEYVSGLEGRLQADLARIAPLLGQGLDDLSAAQLSSLVRVHEDGARRARAMLVSHRFDFWRGESGQQTGICL